MAFQIIELLCQQWDEARQLIRGLTGVRMGSWVAGGLFKPADKAGVSGNGGTRLGHQHIRRGIADMVGCRLETVIRLLSRRQKESLMTSSAGLISILNRQELGRLQVTR